MYEATCVVRPNARVRNALGALLAAVALNVIVISSNDQAEIEALKPPFKAVVCVGLGQTSGAAVCGLRV